MATAHGELCYSRGSTRLIYFTVQVHGPRFVSIQAQLDAKKKFYIISKAIFPHMLGLRRCPCNLAFAHDKASPGHWIPIVEVATTFSYQLARHFLNPDGAKERCH